MKVCFWIATARNVKFMRCNWPIFNHHNALELNVSSALVLPKQRNKSTKSTFPFYHSNIGKSCYLRYQVIKTWNTDISENRKTLTSYILSWWRYIYWKCTINILFFNSYNILRGMYKRSHIFCFFKIYNIKISYISERDLGPFQASRMEFFATVANRS